MSEKNIIDPIAGANLVHWDSVAVWSNWFVWEQWEVNVIHLQHAVNKLAEIASLRQNLSLLLKLSWSVFQNPPCNFIFYRLAGVYYLMYIYLKSMGLICHSFSKVVCKWLHKPNQTKIFDAPKLHKSKNTQTACIYYFR